VKAHPQSLPVGGDFFLTACRVQRKAFIIAMIKAFGDDSNTSVITGATNRASPDGPPETGVASYVNTRQSTTFDETNRGQSKRCGPPAATIHQIRLRQRLFSSL